MSEIFPPQKQLSTHSVAEVMIQQLQLWGVKRIYGVIGDAIFGLMDAIAKQSSIQFIAVKHESVAAMMASAEAKLTGKLGVCIAQMGPGLANLINGLGDAYFDQVPVLVITGQAPINKIGTNYKQYVNQQILIEPFARSSTLVTHPDTSIELLVKAMHISLAESTVTHLSIPKDLFVMKTNVIPQKKTVLLHQTAPFPKEMLQQVAEVMNAAQRPMIVAGISKKSAGSMVERLAVQWGAGIVVPLDSTGIVPDASLPMLGGLGEGGNPYVSNLLTQADVILLIGETMWPENVSVQANVIQINEKAIRIGKGIPVEIGIVGDAESIIPVILEMENFKQNEKWLQQINETKDVWNQQNDQEGKQFGSPVPPSRIVRAIEKIVQSNAIVALDYGDVTIWFKRNFRAKQQDVLVSSYWRTMGFGLPAAMAAKLCTPNRQVVAVVGDGGLSMTLADLLTAIRYQLAITVVLFNNGTLQMEQDKMIMDGYQLEGVDITNPDFVQLAKACGWEAVRVDSAENIEEIMGQAMESNKPVLIDVWTAPIPHPDFRKQSMLKREDYNK